MQLMLALAPSEALPAGSTVPDVADAVRRGLLHQDGGDWSLAQACRRETLAEALRFAGCRQAAPEQFFRGEDENDAEWVVREAAARAFCDATCPVRAACLELALRDRTVDGVRGGLAVSQLRALLRKESKRLVAARSADTAAAKRDRRIRLAQEALDRSARTHLVANLDPDVRARANRETSQAAARLREARAERRSAAAAS